MAKKKKPPAAEPGLPSDDVSDDLQDPSGEEALEAELLASDGVIDVVGEDLPSVPPKKKAKSKKGTKASLTPAKRSSSAVSNTDPLQAYMNDVTRYKLLTPTEEHELAVRLQEDGDVEAARRLVTSNLRLVVKIAHDYRQAYKNILDLIQEGNIGLMQAVKKFDPYRGVKLSSYAAWWIRAYILRFVLNNHRLVKLGTTQAQRKLFFNLKKEKAKLSAMGIEPTPEVIAERLNVPTKDVISMDRRMAAGEVRLDAPIGDGDGRSVARVDMLASPDVRFDDILAETQLGDMLKSEVRQFGTTLVDKERVIFDERLVAEDPKTLQQLGNHFGVSRERIRQIEKRLLGKMRKHLAESLGESVIEAYET